MKLFRIFVLIVASFVLISCTKNDNNITIYLAGDSTIAEKLDEKRPETGWGEKFSLFFDENISISNHAKNGRSTRTFISEGRWQAIMDSVKEGDYVFIQFGHNDQSKNKPDRYTPPEDFHNNLIRFINETREHKAIPVLITPVMRRRFDENGKFYDVHGIYPGIVRKDARETETYLIDLHKSSEKLLEELGEEGSVKLFLHLEPGESPNYPDGVTDDTHFNDYGAKVIAALVAHEIRSSEIPLKEYLKEEG